MSLRCPFPGCGAGHGDFAVACLEHHRLLSRPLRLRIAGAMLRGLEGKRPPLPEELRELARIELRALAGAERHQELMRTPTPAEVSP